MSVKSSGRDEVLGVLCWLSVSLCRILPLGAEPLTELEGADFVGDTVCSIDVVV